MPFSREGDVLSAWFRALARERTVVSIYWETRIGFLSRIREGGGVELLEVWHRNATFYSSLRRRVSDPARLNVDVMDVMMGEIAVRKSLKLNVFL